MALINVVMTLSLFSLSFKCSILVFGFHLVF